MTVLAVAGCGGETSSSPRLADGSEPPALPRQVQDAGGTVLTRYSVLPAGKLDRSRLLACGAPGEPDGAVVERVGLEGRSWTFRSGGDLAGCDEIPDPVEDPDRPYGGLWCGAALGRLEDGHLNDPRLDLCAADDGSLTAFAWVEPGPGTRWVVVRSGDEGEAYAVAAGLPVRVTTTQGVDPEGSASFDVRELAADGSTLRSYALEARVSG